MLMAMTLVASFASISKAGAADGRSCWNESRTRAVKLVDGKLQIFILNGIVPTTEPAEVLTFTKADRRREADGALITDVGLSNGGRAIVRMESKNGKQNLSNLEVTSIRLVDGSGETVEVFATDCQ